MDGLTHNSDSGHIPGFVETRRAGLHGIRRDVTQGGGGGGSVGENEDTKQPGARMGCGGKKGPFLQSCFSVPGCYEPPGNPWPPMEKSGETLTGARENMYDRWVRKNYINFIEAVERSSIQEFSTIRKFSLQELEEATDGFSKENLLLRGRSDPNCFLLYVGYVDRPSSTDPGHTERKKVRVQKFKRRHVTCIKMELWFLSEYRHPNILEVVGFCDEGDGFLVTEFMENGCLDRHLFVEDDASGPVLTWEQRMEIMMGVARALDFLHNHKFPVVFCALFPSCILLDSDFNPKISCFSGAATGPVDFEIYQPVFNDHYEGMEQLNRVVWDLALMCPFVDVCGFALLVLQLLSARRAYDRFPLIDEWAFNPKDPKGKLELVDRKLGKTYVRVQAYKVASMAEDIVQKFMKCPWEATISDMRTVVQVLEKATTLGDSGSFYVYVRLVDSLRLHKLAPLF